MREPLESKHDQFWQDFLTGSVDARLAKASKLFSRLPSKPALLMPGWRRQGNSSLGSHRTPVADSAMHLSVGWGTSSLGVSLPG